MRTVQEHLDLGASLNGYAVIGVSHLLFTQPGILRARAGRGARAPHPGGQVDGAVRQLVGRASAAPEPALRAQLVQDGGGDVGPVARRPAVAEDGLRGPDAGAPGQPLPRHRAV